MEKIPESIASNTLSLQLFSNTMSDKGHSKFRNTVSNSAWEHVQIDWRRHIHDMSVFLFQHVRKAQLRTQKCSAGVDVIDQIVAFAFFKSIKMQKYAKMRLPFHWSINHVFPPQSTSIVD